MYRSSTILRELVQNLAKVTLLLKNSVKLRHCILCGDDAACREMACVLFVVQTDTLHLHTIYNDVKSVLLQAWSGPEGSRKLRLPDFMIVAQEGGKVVSLTHRPHLPPGNSPGTHFC